MNEKRTIKKDISRLFIIIAISISVTASLFTITSVKRMVESHISENLLAVAQLKMDAIETRFKHGISLADQISLDIDVRNNFMDAVVRDGNSEQITKSKQQLRTILEEKLGVSTDIIWADLYDVNYKLVAKIGNENVIDSESVYKHDDDINSIRESRIGDFYAIGEDIYHNIIMPIFHPLRTYDVIGYMVISHHCPYQFNNFNNFNKFTMFGKTGEFIVAQKQNNEIVIISKLRHKQSLPLTEKYSLGSDLQNILASAFSGVGGHIRGLDYRGKEVVSSYLYLENEKIAVIAKIDSDEVFEDVEWLCAGLFLILLAAVIITYFFVSKKLERALEPVAELEHGARIFAQGDLGYRIPIIGSNELSRLTRIFNGMAEKLEKVTASKEELNNQIEKQREVERQLYEERAKLEAIFESNNDSIVVWDKDYYHIYVNRAAAKKISRTKRRIIGKNVKEVFADRPDIAEFWMSKVKQVFTDGEPLESSQEFNLYGKHFYAEFTISPIVSEGDEIIAVGMILRDITKRKLAEDSARESRQMLHNVINSIPVSVFWKDVDSRFLGANMNLAKMLGFNSPEELIGKTDFDINSKEFAEDYRKDDLEVMESKQPKLNYEENFIDENGNKIVINTSKVPLLRNDGTVYSVLGCFVDVTERFNFIERLKEAQREADLANKSKSDFLASMSHEIRTPINAIIGMADVLEQSGINSSQSEYIKILKAAGENLSHLVNNILDYTKIETGDIELHDEEFSLGDALNDSVNLIMLKTHEKNIYLNMNVDAEVQLRLYGDLGKLRQILLNLLNNAAKFTNSGGIDLNVSEWQHATPGKYMLLFEIVDTGSGIPAAKIETIFERFIRLDDSDSQGGAGLGLSICKELVSALGGEIWVESEEGKGSKFSFTASFKPLDMMKMVKHQNSGKLSLRGTVANVCCNSLDLSEQMIKTLEEWKIRVKHTTEPTEKCIAEKSDFIILMPDEKMLDAMVERYKKEDLEKVADKVIIIPQNPDVLESEKLNKLGLKIYLNQPIVRKELYDQLDRIHKQRDKNSGSPVSSDGKFKWYDPARVRVLIADDDPITKKVMRLAFENLGYCIDIASNGNEVLEFMKKDFYDIVFMDTDMPEMDGNETTRQIRELEKDSETRVPIVAVTAKVFDEDRKKAFDSGIDWFLSKPIIVEQMVEAINKLVKLN